MSLLQMLMQFQLWIGKIFFNQFIRIHYYHKIVEVNVLDQIK